jgi:hypothetical protein
MAKAQKRTSPAAIAKSAIAAASSALEALPAKPKSNWSLRETVVLLQDSIVEALSKGYTYPEVAKMLSTRGVEISASSLKSYLSAAKRGAKTSSRKAKASNVVELKPKSAAKSGRQPKLTVVSSTAKSTKTVAKAKSSAARTAAPKAVKTPSKRKKLG